MTSSELKLIDYTQGLTMKISETTLLVKEKNQIGTGKAEYDVNMIKIAAG